MAFCRSPSWCQVPDLGWTGRGWECEPISARGGDLQVANAIQFMPSLPSLLHALALPVSLPSTVGLVPSAERVAAVIAGQLL